MNDSYVHLDKNVYYITECIPTKSTENKYNEQVVQSCQCIANCFDANVCKCLHGNVTNYTCSPQLAQQIERKNITIAMRINDELNKNLPMYECNASCKCKDFCGNRLVQYGPQLNLKIHDCTNRKGLGLITTANIAKGSFVCEYAGEIITEAEAQQRFDYNRTTNLMNFIFCLNEHYGETITRTFVDPSLFGNIGRYLNHSCSPNCQIYPVRVDSIVPKLCIFAKEDVVNGSELTFNYGSEIICDAGSYENLTVCLCGSKNCLKYMPYSCNLK